MNLAAPYHHLQRYRSLITHRIHALPVVILMPHSACNCRCIMCDIWKDNRNLHQLTENDVAGLMGSLKNLGTRQVVMSGGEALLNPLFFELCRILKQAKIRITLLSTGILLKKHAASIAEHINELIVSLDGDEELHDEVRQTKGAYSRLREGIMEIRKHKHGYWVQARTVIHKINFKNWPSIISAAKRAGIDRISFLPADVSSHAFNREIPWAPARQAELLLSPGELTELRQILDEMYTTYSDDFKTGYIAESPQKLEKIFQYYQASLGLASYPSKKCNAPWVSAVIEADGSLRPCFFHAALGNIRNHSLETILNSKEAMQFRKTLDMEQNPVCKKCVCYLNLNPGAIV